MLFNMGQWLSVPFIIWGIYLVVRARKMTPLPEEVPKVKSQEPRKSRKEMRQEKKQKK
jgi:prolipoprotein diacylglyceryltransferase